ncbi:putative SNF2 family helicase/ATPase [Aspergillus saccharolyticus JOP 1030-1]|uniref:SNF2 family helicase/ATPase n=1 Tax=Aspergillus saccharolyticus JOP 1030-1 TaxID=1450539 RepID=A0A318ZHR6_9EURO|nr:hypothetical protein BP01DRAFT_343408 [Aspergillus saccharolyticus JOP 1030-1]PYH44113.1 hypothetical protein BP01DRAFT_343408 [Aspergillus saccharolyticus JOP 1030-1]
MARESDAPLDPMTPRRPTNDAQQQHQQQPRRVHPEFGKATPLRPVHHQSHAHHNPKPHNTNAPITNNNNSSNRGNPFNIPKPNQARPEHHRPQQQSRPQQQPLPHQRGPKTPGPAGAFATPHRAETYDPFQPVRPSAYNNNRFSRPVSNDVVEIRRPENFTFNTPRAPKTFFASKPSAIKMANGSRNLQNFIDLTGEGGFTPSARGRNNGFGSMDVNGFVDTAKANENIKALLEGAFEDDDDEKQKDKLKKKKKDKKKDRKKDKKEAKKEDKKQDLKKMEEKAKDKKQDIADIDDLAAQLESVTVKETRVSDDSEDEGETSSNSPKATTKHLAEEKEDESDSEAEAESEDEEEDEEEEDEDDGTVEGLKVKLLPHQREGVNWMCDKETGRNKTKGVLPKGGILADDMGLGKTVQTIALILSNRKPTSGLRRSKSQDDEEDSDEDEEEDTRKLPPGLSKTTLVVAPLALIKQWEAEILDKVEPSHRLRVLVYHGNARAKATDNLENYDVVITTYGTLTSEHGALDKNKKKTGIFSVYWYRIVLDEAHTIKNRNAKATQSACALDAEYRWCLSGTPLQNNLDELQSLIKFLRIKPFNDLANWREQITKPISNGRGGLAIERLQVYLKIFMKRRTKDVLKQNANLQPGEEGKGGEKKKKSNGFQIVKREVVKVEAEFMSGELDFYKRLEQRTDDSLEKMMGGEKVDYAGALVLLLRLRQSCNHPDLVKSDLAKDKDVLLQTGATGSQQSSGRQDDLDSMADLFGALSVVSRKCDICQMDLSPDEASGGRSRCKECQTTLDTNIMTTDKKRRSGPNAVIDLTQSPSERRSEAQAARFRRNRRVVVDSDDEDEEDGEWIVPEHQRKQSNLGKAGGTDDEDAEGGGEWLHSDDSDDSADSDSDQDGPESPSRKPTSIRKETHGLVTVDSEDDEDIYLNTGDDSNAVLPSTKVRHLMKILRRESADHKFIVFSVFTSMLDKIEPFLKRAGIGFARYDGGMRNDHREASLNKLRNNSGTRVLLCSLRAGALGLNLTAASRVVILEPFWNPFVEEQAIDRVHRLNQTRDVKIYKMIIKGTVEERILDLQERKRELANVTIEGKTAAAKLTMKDMMALFGKDAEARYNGDSNIDLTQTTKLLASGAEAGSPYVSKSSGSRVSESQSQSRERERNRPQGQRAPRTEDSVYGRRW